MIKGMPQALVITETIKVLKECYLAYEHEETEREKVRATVKMFCHAVDRYHETLSQQLAQNHTQRMAIISAFTDSVRQAVKDGDVKMVTCLTQGLSALVQLVPAVKSPELPVNLPHKELGDDSK